MLDSYRSLLQRGNSKLGRAIHVWSIPAIDTCPGSTAVCRKLCYATRHRFRFASVRRRLAWNRGQCDRSDFVERMIAEIRSVGVLVLRIHVAGDFYSPGYVRKWIAVIKASPRVRFYGYTRSWQIASIAPALAELSRLGAMRLWYSIDAETGIPQFVPPNVRLAYLQTTPASPPEQAHLVFRPQRLRTLPDLPTVCDHETPAGKQLGVTCGSCGRCFR